jgi:hypothetical protein
MVHFRYDFGTGKTYCKLGTILEGSDLRSMIDDRGRVRLGRDLYGHRRASGLAAFAMNVRAHGLEHTSCGLIFRRAHTP